MIFYFVPDYVPAERKVVGAEINLVHLLYVNGQNLLNTSARRVENKTL